jgi:hypothetical protein
MKVPTWFFLLALTACQTNEDVVPEGRTLIVTDQHGNKYAIIYDHVTGYNVMPVK